MSKKGLLLASLFLCLMTASVWAQNKKATSLAQAASTADQKKQADNKPPVIKRKALNKAVAWDSVLQRMSLRYDRALVQTQTGDIISLDGMKISGDCVVHVRPTYHSSIDWEFRLTFSDNTGSGIADSIVFKIIAPPGQPDKEWQVSRDKSQPETLSGYRFPPGTDSQTQQQLIGLFAAADVLIQQGRKVELVPFETDPGSNWARSLAMQKALLPFLPKALGEVQK